MNYVENNGKKVAAVLCVASAFPVVATVYAKETQPGWHGDKYINSDATIAKGWQEIEGKSYFFSEVDGTVDEETTETAVVASVSAEIMGDIEDDMTTSAKLALEGPDELEGEVETLVVEESPTVDPIIEETVVVDEYAEEEIEGPISQSPVVSQAPVEDIPIAVDAPEINPTPVTNEATAYKGPVAVTSPIIDSNVNANPGVQLPNPTPPAPPVNQTPVVDSGSTNPYHQLNQNIANAAVGLVGVTDGQWCTQVVQQALAGAGVQDAYQLWPDEYASMYGYYTNTPEAGNLVYYYNGGRGVDHIAVYIGDGMCVHGNYGYGDEMGKTVIASVYINGGEPQYIQVQR